MAITGTGTADDPWVVHNMAEIAEKASQRSMYIKLANDIDVSKEYSRFGGITLNSTLDLNGFAIKNILVTGGVFATEWGCTIKNGKIINIYCENNSKNLFAGKWGGGSSPRYYVNLNNVAVSVNKDSSSLLAFSYVKMNLCNVSITCTDGRMNNLSSNSSATDTRFYFEILNDASTSELFAGSLSTNGCCFEGVWTGRTKTTSFSVPSGFWAVDTTGLENASALTISGNTMVDVEKNPAVTLDGTQIKRRTTEQILSVEYNNNNGFPVGEVV